MSGAYYGIWGSKGHTGLKGADQGLLIGIYKKKMISTQIFPFLHRDFRISQPDALV